MTNRVMVDIETLGTEPGAAILSIGAVTFDVDGVNEEFYEEISVESCQAVGLDIDAGTLTWWLDEQEQASDILTGGHQLEDVLLWFAHWMPEDAEIWANAPTFDCAMVEAAYDAVAMRTPWEYYDERCVRTLRSLPCAVDLEQDGQAHHALDDAIHQAREVSQTLARLDRPMLARVERDGGDVDGE